jgi:hypothetical protein
MVLVETQRTENMLHEVVTELLGVRISDNATALQLLGVSSVSKSMEQATTEGASAVQPLIYPPLYETRKFITYYGKSRYSLVGTSY